MEMHNKAPVTMDTKSRRASRRDEALAFEIRNAMETPDKVAAEATMLLNLLHDAAVVAPGEVLNARQIRLRDSGRVEILVGSFCLTFANEKKNWRHAYADACRFLIQVRDYGTWATQVLTAKATGTSFPDAPIVSEKVRTMFGSAYEDMARTQRAAHAPQPVEVH